MKASDYSNIGSKIRKERRSIGLSQSELSKKLNISASYLNLIESGRRSVTVPLLIKLGNELKLSLKDLTIESNKRLLSDVMEALSHDMFDDLDITNQETTEFISNSPNLAKALETIKSMNVWVVGTAEEAESNLNTLNADRPWLVLLGNEEKGLRRLTREACDVLTRIENHSNTVTSLNVSVAAGVALSTLRSRA